MALALPTVHASATHQTVTLDELRDLVAACTGLDGSLIVRANLVPFRMADLTSRNGGCVNMITVDQPPK